jgi:predicted regulator of Ras-like GTPase activity (Roadblock/LC7/MglB family)
MNITCVDTQTIGGTSGQVFEMIQTGAVEALVTLKNTGTNTANYVFQEKIGAVWTDMASLGNPLNDTLSPDEVVALKVSSSYPQVRLMANASGGTVFEFAVLRYFDRGDGGALPILTL